MHVLGALLLAFAAGAASFLSPCVLPVLPGYLAAVAGVGGAVRFLAGFLATFVALGVGVSQAGQLATGRRAAGVLVLAFGLVLLVGTRRLPWRGAAPLAGRVAFGGAGPLLLGVALALSFTPCATPLLASILALAAASQSAARGASLLSAYALGLGVPLLLVGLTASRLIARIRAGHRAIELAAAAALLLTGASLLHDGTYAALWAP
jgi:cytochrome c-type biogenesis protein